MNLIDVYAVIFLDHIRYFLLYKQIGYSFPNQSCKIVEQKKIIMAQMKYIVLASTALLVCGGIGTFSYVQLVSRNISLLLIVRS